MDEQQLRGLLEEMNISPKASVPILDSIKHGPCACGEELKEADRYIRELEAEIRRLRDRYMFP